MAANSQNRRWICGPHLYDVKIDFSLPGKPTDNAYVESFKGTFRDECLNMHWFESLLEAKQLIEGSKLSEENTMRAVLTVLAER